MRTIVGAILLCLVLASCGGAPSPTAVEGGRATAIDQFPADPGRGFAVAQVAGSPQAGPRLQPGVAAPDFAFFLEDGRFSRVSDLKGRPVIINFWATWCGPCRQEMPELVSAANEHDALVVLAVNQEETRSLVESFAKEFKMDMPIILDSDGKVGDLYQVRGLPTTYFIDADGKVAAVFIGRMTPQALTERLAEIL